MVRVGTNGTSYLYVNSLRDGKGNSTPSNAISHADGYNDKPGVNSGPLLRLVFRLSAFNKSKSVTLRRRRFLLLETYSRL